MKILIVSRQRLFAEVVARALQADEPDLEARVVTTLDEALEQMSVETPDIVLVDDELLDVAAGDDTVRVGFGGVRTVLVVTSERPGALDTARCLGCSQVIGRGARLADVRAVLRSTSTGMAAVGLQASGPAPERAHGTAFGLTSREMEVLRQLTLGADNAAIARILAISQNTVRTHVQNIFTKLGVSSRLAAATLAIHSGTIPPEPATVEEPTA